jgi:hypothetical protein
MKDRAFAFAAIGSLAVFMLIMAWRVENLETAHAALAVQVMKADSIRLDSAEWNDHKCLIPRSGNQFSIWCAPIQEPIQFVNNWEDEE